MEGGKMDEIQKKMASSRILAIVGEYEKERVEARRLPTHILLTELKNRAKFDHADILEALGDLEAKGYIETGRTINDTYIRLKK